MPHCPNCGRYLIKETRWPGGFVTYREADGSGKKHQCPGQMDNFISKAQDNKDRKGE